MLSKWIFFLNNNSQLTVLGATKADLLTAPVENNHMWIINMPLYVNEYLGFFVKFDSIQTGTFSNTVLASSDETPDKKPATDDVLVVSESYTVEKKALNTTVKVGEQVTFSIIVTNTGGTIIEGGINFKEEPDSSLVFDHAIIVSGEWTNESDIYWYFHGELQPGQSAELQFVYNTTKTGNITNTIVVTDVGQFNATVEVTNETDDENQTTPDDGENEDEPDNEEEVIQVPSGSAYGEASSTYESPKSVGKNATGNPFLALIVVFLTLLLIRRRNE